MTRLLIAAIVLLWMFGVLTVAAWVGLLRVM